MMKWKCLAYSSYPVILLVIFGNHIIFAELNPHGVQASIPEPVSPSQSRPPIRRIPENRSKYSECFHFSDASQFCIHRNYSLCLIDNNFAFVDDSKAEGSFYEINNELPDDYMHLDFKEHFHTSDAFPYRFTARPMYISSKTVASIGHKLRKFHGTSSLFTVDFDFANIYHFASTLLLAYSARLSHELPEFDKIISAELEGPEACNDAALQFRTILMGPRDSYKDWHENFVSAAISRCTTTWTFESVVAQMQRGPMCFETAYTFGKSTYLLPGTLYADSFRSRIADLYGISYERKAITICLRKGKRTILNSVSFVRFVSDLSPTEYPVRVIDGFENMPFIEQAKIMASSAMFISVHGAALTNIIFMPKDSVVLELSPFRFNYWLYHRIARNAGLRYVRYTGSLDESMYKEPLRDAIRNVMNTPLTNRMCVNQIADCMGFLRDVDLHVNTSRFEPFLESALQLL